MDTFDLFAILTGATGLALLVNGRFLRLPPAMGLVLIGVVILGIGMLLELLGVPALESIKKVVPKEYQFKSYLLDGGLSLLLYAAAVSIDPGKLRKVMLPVLFFSTVGVVLSTLFVGFGCWFGGNLSGFPISLVSALLFGAIISPTDVTAVSKVIDRIPESRAWKSILIGESLFNDAIALLLVTVFIQFATNHAANTTGSELALIFIRDLGLAVGIGAGLAIAVSMLSYACGDVSEEGRILLSISLATGSYTLAIAFDASGPIAVVTAGLTVMWMIRKAPNFKPMESGKVFWSIIERGFSGMFFLLMAFESLFLDWTWFFLFVGIGGWIMVLVSRLLTVLVGYGTTSLFLNLGSAVHFLAPMTLAGVRGAISVALAISLPDSIADVDRIQAMVYGTVVLGILVQGGMLLLLAHRLKGSKEESLKLRAPLRSLIRPSTWFHRAHDTPPADDT